MTATQMSSAKRGIATEEMKQVAKDEDVTLEFIVRGLANGSIIIPKNNARPQQEKRKIVGIGKSLKTKVNVNIGTSTLHQNLEEEVSKAKVAVKYGADTIIHLWTASYAKSFYAIHVLSDCSILKNKRRLQFTDDDNQTPEYGQEALISTIDDEKELINSLRQLKESERHRKIKYIGECLSRSNDNELLQDEEKIQTVIL
jgi:hypothetical protein